MSKFLNLKFTGSIVVTPEYPDDVQQQICPPLIAMMPGARRRRRSGFRGKQVDAQFAFVVFDYGQILKDGESARDADYKYPSIDTVSQGVCFLEREDLLVNVEPSPIRFVDGDTSLPPTVSSRETKRIARWSDFSNGNGQLKARVLQDHGEYARVVMPAGTVSSGYVSGLVTRIDFDYGDAPRAAAYAHEIVVSIEFPDDSPSVDLQCIPFPGSTDQSSTLTFTWGAKPSIDLLFGNGTLASLSNVLTDAVAGQDHGGDYDVDFNAIYDIVNCLPDAHGRTPLPHIENLEILRVPCAPTMIGSPTLSSDDRHQSK